jgi:DNA polymerase elongation subunit (family B)
MTNDNIVQINSKFNTITEVYRDESGIKKKREIDFPNSFFFRLLDEDQVKEVLDSTTNKRGNVVEYKLEHTDKKSIYNDILVEILPNKYDFWAVKKALHQQKIKTFEANLDVRLKHILKTSPKFLSERHLGIIDIETDMSLDCVNTPVPITSICVYSTKDQTYYIWVLENELKEEIKPLTGNTELFTFKREQEMLQHFMLQFREFDFDICGGWNSENYDWPYIINRISKLGLNPCVLSRFGEVECRPYMMPDKTEPCFTNTIAGVDLVDFIPVLKKNTCYSPQPASFSLASTSSFYLDIPKLTNIGAQAWKTNINDFIQYNIRDVELVKLIVEKFKLIDFLLVIQNDIAPVTLNNATHNSIVLLYYLKSAFKDTILPDNIGYIDINGDSIDLSYQNIRIQAARVIDAVAGIHDSVSIFDFAGLYPSIFRTFNISPDTVSNEGVEVDDINMSITTGTGVKEYSNLKAKFTQDKKGIYPIILERLTLQRNLHKARMKQNLVQYGKDDPKYFLELYRSDVLKQISNSLYGVGAFNKFPIFNPIVSAAVTSISRKMLTVAEEYCNSLGYQVLTGDTDSIMFKHPKDLDTSKFSKDLNIKLKSWVQEKYPILNINNFCLDMEYQKTFKTFVMKDAKKKYYGILLDGSFYAKGFEIVQHSYSPKIKEILKEMYIMLMTKPNVNDLRISFRALKTKFYSLDENDLYVEWKMAKNPEEYDTNVQHIRAAKYSNTYLGTNFKSGDAGKLVFVKENIFTEKYPQTNVILLDENTKLPNELSLDKDLMWEKMIVNKLNLLSDIPEMPITQLLSNDRSLDEFFK